MLRNRTTIRGLTAATTCAVATVGLTVGMNAWAAEPTATEPGVTQMRSMPHGAAVRMGGPKPMGERLAEIKAAQHRRALRKAAAARAAREAAREARQDRQQRASRSASRSYSGDPRGIAQEMAAAKYGWTGGEFDCLDSLWEHESGWDTHASNSSSGAYGIPQALPGSKMGEYGSDWADNPATQIEWGLAYIDGRYGTPCGAWDTFQSQGWY